MGIGKALADFFLGPATDVLKEAIPDPDKRREIQAALLTKAMDHEAALVASARDVIVSEAQSQSWLTRSWRPITMLTFVGLITARWLGLATESITPEIEMKLLDIVQVGLGGYMIGRSAEQVAKEIGPALGKK